MIKRFFIGFGLAILGMLAGLILAELLMAWPFGTMIVIAVLVGLFHAFTK